MHTAQVFFLRRKYIIKEQEKRAMLFCTPRIVNYTALHDTLFEACKTAFHSKTLRHGTKKSIISIMYSLRSGMRVVKLSSKRWMGHFSPYRAAEKCMQNVSRSMEHKVLLEIYV